jgi:hypothetical protein
MKLDNAALYELFNTLEPITMQTKQYKPMNILMLTTHYQYMLYKDHT